jgi:hypothetical protein
MTKRAAKINEDLNQVESQMQVVKGNDVVSISIREAKITKDQTVTISYREYHEDATFDDVSRDCLYLAHKDLLDAFDKAVPHLIITCDLREIKVDKKGFHQEPDSYDMSELDHIRITGFIMKGFADAEGVILLGQKEVDGRTILMKAPLVKWMDSYPFSTELQEAIKAMQDEVLEYLRGKHAAKQMKMEFEDEGESEE